MVLNGDVRSAGPQSLWTVMFAENTVIYNESRKQVAEDLVKWRYVLERRGTKVITVKNKNQQNFRALARPTIGHL